MSTYFPKRYYAGRKADLNFLVVSNPDQLATAPQDLGVNQVCTGVLKLAQKVALRLLTPVDGVLYEPSEGAVFMTDAIANNIFSVPDLQASMTTAIASVTNQFVDDLIADPFVPTDEQLASIQIVTSEIVGDKALVTLQINSVAGDSVTWIAPLTIQPV